ncbi:lactate utilization protein [Flavobacteriaceae bacterium XHP0103]|uniref:LutC/YkgG family protein n=1 Tax=Marixanthotalea marina TaxID=2844359 RepID=UPI002989C9A9|nr:LUD domain-containing protein [Marixanthotalea marina]MBU3821001.1 lactate utilization protein [Marixanthotalea marina]
MASKEDILSKIKANKPDFIELPDMDFSVFDDRKPILEEFIKKVELAGGSIFEVVSIDDVLDKVSSLFPDAKQNYAALNNSEHFNTLNLENVKQAQDLERLDVLVLESDLGVAENGAVWIDDKQLPLRVLPFITKHLVFVLEKNKVVGFMHEAYQKLNLPETGFGVFISGPSKTADIEQSLVLGAHGALSLTVLLV